MSALDRTLLQSRSLIGPPGTSRPPSRSGSSLAESLRSKSMSPGSAWALSSDDYDGSNFGRSASPSSRPTTASREGWSRSPTPPGSSRRRSSGMRAHHLCEHRRVGKMQHDKNRKVFFFFSHSPPRQWIAMLPSPSTSTDKSRAQMVLRRKVAFEMPFGALSFFHMLYYFKILTPRVALVFLILAVYSTAFSGTISPSEEACQSQTAQLGLVARMSVLHFT